MTLTRTRGASTAPRVTKARINNRRDQLVAAAARLLQQQSFDRSSMRAIAAMAGMQGGSVYYHFRSKEELFQAVNEAALEHVEQAVRAAIDDVRNPWDRLEAAAAAHCEALFGPSRVLGAIWLGFTPMRAENRRRMVAARNRYETLIASLVDSLEMPAGVTRKMFRLHFLGSLNYASTWFRAGRGATPAEIGRDLVRMLRPRSSRAVSPISRRGATAASRRSAGAPRRPR